jgi:hypothetical protein
MMRGWFIPAFATKDKKQTMIDLRGISTNSPRHFIFIYTGAAGKSFKKCTNNSELLNTETEGRTDVLTTESPIVRHVVNNLQKFVKS